jgi:hypothetical protein
MQLRYWISAATLPVVAVIGGGTPVSALPLEVPSVAPADAPEASAEGALAPAVDTVTRTVEPVVEAAAPVVETVTATAAPVVETVTATVAPVVETVTATVAPVVEPVAPVVAPAAPVVNTVAPVVEPVAQTVAPVVNTVAPVVEPATQTVAPVAEPVAPVVNTVAPVVEPVVEPMAPTVSGTATNSSTPLSASGSATWLSGAAGADLQTATTPTVTPPVTGVGSSGTPGGVFTSVQSTPGLAIAPFIAGAPRAGLGPSALESISAAPKVETVSARRTAATTRDRRSPQEAFFGWFGTFFAFTGAHPLRILAAAGAALTLGAALRVSARRMRPR